MLAPSTGRIAWLAWSMVLAAGCAGEPRVLVAGVKLPRCIAVDSAFVYWTSTDRENSLGLVSRMPLRGGRVTTLYRGWRADPAGLALDEHRVYWTEAGSTGRDGRVLSARKEGGGVVVIAEGQHGPRSIAVDEHGVYWTNRGAGEAGGSISLASPDGDGTVTTIAAARSNPWSIAVGEGRVFWTEVTIGYAGSVAVSGRVVSAAAKGGSVRVIARTRRWPQEIAFDAGRVYWTEQSGAHEARGAARGRGTVVRADVGGRGRRVLAALDQMPSAIAVGGGRVYWLQTRLHDEASPGFCYTLASVGEDAGAVRVLATEERGPGALAVRAGAVYWTDIGVARPFSRPRFDGAIHVLED